jgi:hypothetical protein
LIFLGISSRTRKELFNILSEKLYFKSKEEDRLTPPRNDKKRAKQVNFDEKNANKSYSYFIIYKIKKKIVKKNLIGKF